MYCKDCGHRVRVTKRLDHPYYCKQCEEGKYSFEVEYRPSPKDYLEIPF